MSDSRVNTTAAEPQTCGLDPVYITCFLFPRSALTEAESHNAHNKQQSVIVSAAAALQLREVKQCFIL